jgi:hypothetical protein
MCKSGLHEKLRGRKQGGEKGWGGGRREAVDRELFDGLVGEKHFAGDVLFLGAWGES